MEIDDHAEELASDLGVDKAEVKSDLETFLEYNIPLEEAISSLREKYGETSDPTATEIGAIEDITTEETSVSLTATVLTVGTREIHYDGETQVIREGKLADNTDTISYTAWEDFGLEPGDTLTIENGGVREFRGEPEINLGESSTVEKIDETLDVDARIGGERSLTELAVGDSGRTLEVVIEEVETRTISGRDGETTIKSGVLADESGRLPFTDWAARSELQPGATLRLADVYVREFRGVPEVSLSKFTTVSELDREIQPGTERARKTIGEAIETGGAYDIEVVGNLIDVRDGSGLIERCPDCNRIVQNDQCRTHGEVDPVDDLRIKAVLDDGTGAVTVILDSELTAMIYGGGIDTAKQEAREAMDKSVVKEKLTEKLVGYEYRVCGHLSVDDYGATLEATAFERVDADPETQSTELLTEVTT